MQEEAEVAARPRVCPGAGAPLGHAGDAASSRPTQGLSRCKTLPFPSKEPSAKLHPLWASRNWCSWSLAHTKMNLGNLFQDVNISDLMKKLDILGDNGVTMSNQLLVSCSCFDPGVFCVIFKFFLFCFV